MKRRSFLASGTAAFAASGTAARAVSSRLTIRERLTTRAESSNYLATSSSADVSAFLNALDQRGAPIRRGSIGRTREGREIPFVVASRPMVQTPQEAQDTGRPILLLVGGSHGGEVEGKEALLALLRDLCISTERTLLEDLVLVFVPLLNPDGNDRFGPQAVNRPLQNGPARIGIEGNGAGIDLDDDFIKTDAAETRALLELVNHWKPHAFVDARTDDGSFVDYGVTYAPSLTPAAYYGGSFVRKNVLSKLKSDLHDKFAIESFGWGHFGRGDVAFSPPPLANRNDYGWFAYDGRPRSAVNYMGLRGIAAARINGYSHDVFERRIYNIRAAIESFLGFCSDNDDAVVGSYMTSTRWLGGKLPIRAALPRTTPAQLPVVYEDLAVASAPSDEPGIPKGLKRTGIYTTATMPNFDTYAPTLVVEQPKAYLIPYESVFHIKPHLDRHGVVSETLISAKRFAISEYVVERIAHDETAGSRRTTSVSGHWRSPASYASRFGALYVPGGQPLGPLVSILLEPESSDGLVTWNALDGSLKPGSTIPIYRVLA